MLAAAAAEAEAASQPDEASESILPIYVDSTGTKLLLVYQLVVGTCT